MVGWWKWLLELPLATSTWWWWFMMRDISTWWWWWWLVMEDQLARASRQREILVNRVYLDLVDWRRVILRELLLRT